MKVCRLCRRYAQGSAGQCAFDGGELLEAPVPPLAPGETMGRFEVKRALAAGQTGVLLLCLDKGKTEDQDVVIKVLNKLAAPVDARRAVLDSAAALHAEGLHPIDEVFEHDERLCIVQAVLTGTTLAAMLPNTGPLEPAEAVVLGRRLCEALTIIHESGLAHYDIRPGHLFVPEGSPSSEALLFDLGMPSPPGRLAPPERYDDAPDPVRSDIYGLCVTLYVALAGRSPFRTDSVEELSWLIHNAPPPPLRVVRKTGGVDPSLERLITWGMSKDPGDRPSLKKVREALEGMASGDHEAVDKALKDAADDTAKQVRRKSVRSSSVPMRSPVPRLGADTSATLKFVRKIFPKNMLKPTGVTHAFFVEGDEIEREVEMAAYEETLARRELLSAWYRLLTLLIIALALGGVTVWALMR